MLFRMIRSKLPQTGTSIFSVMSSLASEHKAINLSQGFPNFDPPQELIDLVTHYMKQGMNQYAPMPGLPILRHRLADKHLQHSGLLIDWETEITITAGATQAIFTAILTLVHPGDEVILLEPAYDSYRPAIQMCGGIPVAYSLPFPDYRINWTDFAKCITPRTRLIIINTPHNPTGTVWTEEDWQQLANLVQDKDIFILSDEVYEQLIFDHRRHYSLLDFPELFAQGIATYSFGKTFHATGWKMGYCIAPQGIMQEFRKIHQFNVFAVNTPMQYAIADFLKEENYFRELPSFYQQKRDLLTQLMEDSPLQPLSCEGTYFQLYDYSAVSDESDVAFTRWLTTDVGVATIPVSAFRTQPLAAEKVLRICFAKTTAVLEAAAERLCRLSPT